MTSPYRSNISFLRLATDCWEILQENREASFPHGSRAAPSRVVFVFPRFDMGYPWDFWENVVVPVLTALKANTPPYLGGWGNPGSKTLVEAALLSAIDSSAWSTKVDRAS